MGKATVPVSNGSGCLRKPQYLKALEAREMLQYQKVLVEIYMTRRFWKLGNWYLKVLVSGER